MRKLVSVIGNEQSSQPHAGGVKPVLFIWHCGCYCSGEAVGALHSRNHTWTIVGEMSAVDWDEEVSGIWNPANDEPAARNARGTVRSLEKDCM